MPERDTERDQLTARLKLIEAALALGMTLWCLWTMVPEHRRQLLRMGLALRAERVMGNAARRLGVLSMGAELATGEQNYVLAYWLSRAREQAGRAYDRARGVTPLCAGSGNGRPGPSWGLSSRSWPTWLLTPMLTAAYRGPGATG